MATASAFRGDLDASVQVIIADVRAYHLTRDARYRDALLAYAADPKHALLRVPAVEQRRAHTPTLQEIGHVYALPHELRMSRTAPADEYFGGLGFSPMGIDNEDVRINQYLDHGLWPRAV